MPGSRRRPAHPGRHTGTKVALRGWERICRRGGNREWMEAGGEPLGSIVD